MPRLPTESIAMRCRDLFGYSLRGVRKIAESSEEGSSNLMGHIEIAGYRGVAERIFFRQNQTALDGFVFCSLSG